MRATHVFSNFRFAAISALVGLSVVLAHGAAAQGAAYKQAIAEAAAKNKVLAQFYQSYGYEGLWTGRENADKKRRRALLKALEGSNDHGLPANLYKADTVRAKLRASRSPSERGALDVELSALFLEYARDVGTGILVPRRVDEEIKRRVQPRDPLNLLTAFSQSSPTRFIALLPPQSPEYTRLLKAKIEIEEVAAKDAWGAVVPKGRLEIGDSGPRVVALRDRLSSMGYMRRTSSATFDAKLEEAVKAFQAAHGLAQDGVVGPGTLGQINVPPRTRLAQIVVAMERERWLARDRGKRHILVNITDYSAKIVDNGKVTFRTRAVVGANMDDRRTPEFSDEMEFMVVNPSWYVPRSIAVKEYLPLLQEDPFAVSHLQLLDDNRQVVNRVGVDFASLDEETFPFLMKEPPSQGNALGLVKFMFPNRHNIYLHDTPAKNLFARETRAFSHGCIRLRDPMGFAHALLAVQTGDPEGVFRRALARDKEVQLDLKEHVPVHLIYRTAVTTARGDVHFRRDVYRRDARIFRALSRAGVELRDAGS